MATYHQLRGTAMGCSCAPTYANRCLGWWEAMVVFGDDAPELTNRIGLWARYIDNVFIVWQGSRNDFLQFVDSLNHNQLGLRFTSEIATENKSVFGYHDL